MNPWKTPGFLIRPGYDRRGKYPSDLAVLGARVLTCDENRTRAAAVAVKDGKFTCVGSNREVRNHIGPETTVINAGGRMLIPGFVDNHVHVLWMSMLGSIIVDLYGCDNLDEVIARTRAHAEANPELPLVMGIGWMYHHMPGGLPDPALLDSLFPDRPVFLLSYEACTLWTNSLMRQLMWERCPGACTRMQPQQDPDTGKPTGLFMLSHSFNPFEFFGLEEFGDDIKEKMLAGMEQGIRRALEAGVTAFDELQVYQSVIPLILKLRDRGGFDDIRARLTYYVDPVSAGDWDALEADLLWWKELGEKESDPRLTMGKSLKLYIDGVHSNHTCFMSEPFSDRDSEHGQACWSQDQFDRFMVLADRMDLQACIHSIGDAGITRVINSCERALEANGKPDARHRVDHCECILPGDVPRMARAGIHAAMQPIHFFGDESHERVLGRERLQWYMPWRSLLEAGVNISCGTDWLAVTELPPVNPMYGLIIMATRLNYRLETDWGPDEKIDIEDAIRCYTIGSARALKMEKDIGSIETGKSADFSLFRTNLLKIASWWFLVRNRFEPGGIDDFVDMTVVDGRVVYSRKGARGIRTPH